MKNKSQEIILKFISHLFTQRWLKEPENSGLAGKNKLPCSSILCLKEAKSIETNDTFLWGFYVCSFFSLLILYLVSFHGNGLNNQNGWIASFSWINIIILNLIKIIRRRIKKSRNRIGEIGLKLSKDWHFFLKRLDSTRIPSIFSKECNFEKVPNERLLISLESVFRMTIKRIVSDIEKSKDIDKIKERGMREELARVYGLADSIGLKIENILICKM